MIREKDGIHIDSSRFVMDARSTKGEINFTSHAHMDHVHRNSESVVASDLTAKLASERLDKKLEASKHPDIRLLDSGHILGSSSALIENGDEKILYTGDVSLQDRAYLEGFDPVEADKLVVESTYGIPAYRLPDQREVEKDIKAWIKETESPFLFGYSLGKAQKIQYLVQEVTDRPLVAHGAVKKMNDVVEKHTDLEFNALEYGENKDLLRKGEGIFIGPTNFSRKDALNRLVDEASGKKAGFSGWGVQDSYRHRGGYDKVFPYSDHCGFDDLVELVEKVDPEKIYTHHGFDEAFAKHLSSKMGYNARALKNNQASLTDF
ncbi:MBL fold metallo-hydrolase RNA specificity domain-containing protein [Candidatus Nanosalina sp. VS9-1]|uniref:MBL fold metallo-hydrolase RNA specificity domain-containing protein n=1 Tax=Candidatus Nanosalina sp. VS9-1 TaxID=3388566 RepID=UPI0039E0DC45